MVIGFWLLTGTIGFYATYFFIRKIYAAVKQDWKERELEDDECMSHHSSINNIILIIIIKKT